MAATVDSVYVTVILLMCVLGAGAVDLLRATQTQDGPSPPRVHCWCASYPNVTLCSWPQPPHSPPTHYIASCRERHGQRVTNQCQLFHPNSSSSNLTSSSSSQQLWQCHLPNLKLLTHYIMNVTAVYPGGSRSHLSSFMLEEIVKPDPPKDLKVSSLNTKNLLVEWSPPPTWANLDIVPLKYHILYRWENKGLQKSVNLGPFESTKVELKGLSPQRTYLFQVCAKELLGLGQCSDWSSPVNITIPTTKP